MGKSPIWEGPGYATAFTRRANSGIQILHIWRLCIENNSECFWFTKLSRAYAYKSGVFLKFSKRVPAELNRFTASKALAWGAFWKLERLWRSSELPISTKIKLFHTTCVTIFLYSCESWVLSQDIECKINAFATSSYRVMLNIKRRDHVSNTIIYSMTDTQPLVHCVRKRQLSFLGHVLRLPEEEPVRRYALYIPPHGKRRPGCPRTSYQSYIKRLLGYDEDDMSADQIATLAQDRCAWMMMMMMTAS